MYDRKNNPETIFPIRLKKLMAEYAKEDGDVGLTCIELARLLYEKQNACEDQSTVNERYALARDNAQKALAQKIGRFRNGKYFPQWKDLVEIAEFFGKPIGYLIGETDCNSYELQDVADIVGLEGETVAALKRMTRRVSVEWLLEKTTPENEKPPKQSVSIAQDMVDKANAEPDACRAVLNRMITAKTFRDLLISLSNVGECEYELLMTRIDAEVTKLRQEVDAGGTDNPVMQQMAIESAMRDVAMRLREAESALKASRYEAYEFYVRLVDEMFSDMADVDAAAKAKLIVTKP